MEKEQAFTAFVNKSVGEQARVMAEQLSEAQGRCRALEQQARESDRSYHTLDQASQPLPGTLN